MAKLVETCLQKLSPFLSALTKVATTSDGGESEIARSSCTLQPILAVHQHIYLLPKIHALLWCGESCPATNCNQTARMSKLH